MFSPSLPSHGTQCAGTVAAAANNCTIGVSFQARIGGEWMRLWKDLWRANLSHKVHESKLWLIFLLLSFPARRHPPAEWRRDGRGGGPVTELQATVRWRLPGQLGAGGWRDHRGGAGATGSSGVRERNQESEHIQECLHDFKWLWKNFFLSTCKWHLIP